MTATMSKTPRPVFPRFALVFFALLIGGSLLLAWLGSAGKLGDAADGAPAAEVIASRTIRFEDLPDGALAIVDHQTGDRIETLPPGNEGFIRGVLRGIARERNQYGVAMNQPFQLTHWADGQLALDDLSVERRWRLNGFGVDNERAFSRLLDD